jgi:hypothetical protein
MVFSLFNLQMSIVQFFKFDSLITRRSLEIRKTKVLGRGNCLIDFLFFLVMLRKRRFLCTKNSRRNDENSCIALHTSAQENNEGCFSTDFWILSRIYLNNFNLTSKSVVNLKKIHIRMPSRTPCHCLSN